jgi:hypothetical protein
VWVGGVGARVKAVAKACEQKREQNTQRE